MRAPARPAAAFLAGAAVAAALLLSACTGAHPSASTDPAPHTTASDSATPTPTASAAPVLVPGGTAAANQPYFDKVNQATIAAKPGAKGRDFIDGLVAAGFTKADMQLTPDTTTIGLTAPSIQFSVKFGDSCVIGQYGPDSGGYTSLTSPALATGGCLIGQTRPIDW
ncbi:DUF6993 domain-containing protein [Leifsonia shinshuensis]|uniref:DUF6993 domain-containing protein n=1 Tax=Leifsonia shinshuensis TaxID=150026 RepID=A0A7G6Y7F9_9MICO|nr:hypothetical protein [Leifsonia shinshuensis]QNE34424.1 hypothetical protein F1C12_04250 [Leifsonia shinshuensis]